MAFSVGAAFSFNQRLQSHPNMYATYRQLMRSYVNRELDDQTLVSELETLFKSHHDFLHGYRMFLPTEIRKTLPPLPPRQSRKRVTTVEADMNKLRHCIDFINKIKKRFGNERGVYLAYLDTIKEFSMGKLLHKEVYDTVAKLFGDENQDLVDEFELMLGKRKINKKKEEDKFKKAEEENASASPSSTSSDENKSSTRKKSREDEQNIYNRMEDEMFEADIHFSRVKATVESATELMKHMRDSPQQHQIINIDEYFSVLNLCCIRDECKEQGFSIIERLRQDPKHVVPQIFSRLKNKLLLLEEEKLARES